MAKKKIQYKILGEADDFRHRTSIEINGRIRFAGEVLDETEFNPASGIIVKTDYPDGSFTELSELSELESLLATKHIERIN